MALGKRLECLTDIASQQAACEQAERTVARTGCRALQRLRKADPIQIERRGGSLHGSSRSEFRIYGLIERFHFDVWARRSRSASQCASAATWLRSAANGAMLGPARSF